MVDRNKEGQITHCFDYGKPIAIGCAYRSSGNSYCSGCTDGSKAEINNLKIGREKHNPDFSNTPYRVCETCGYKAKEGKGFKALNDVWSCNICGYTRTYKL